MQHWCNLTGVRVGCSVIYIHLFLSPYQQMNVCINKSRDKCSETLCVQLFITVSLYCNCEFFSSLPPFGDRVACSRLLVSEDDWKSAWVTETESLEQARDRVGCVHPLSRKLVKQSQTVQSAMYSCDTVITTKVLAPAVHSQLGLSPCRVLIICRKLQLMRPYILMPPTYIY